MGGRELVFIRLIVNADDFGYSKGVNLGIIESYRNGIVSSTTMMTNMPGVDHAFQLMDQNIGLGVGIHLVLTTGSPVCKDVPSLVNSEGNFFSLATFPDWIKEEEVEKEFNCQMEVFLSRGHRPTHIDSHHHVHRHPKVLPIVLDFARRYKLPIRLGNKGLLKTLGYEDINTTELFIEDFFGANVSKDGLIRIIKESIKFKSVEIMCHPGFVDQTLLQGSSYNTPRAKEVEILTHFDVVSTVRELGFHLVNFSSIS